jgi:hypothetical protein
MRKSIFRRAGPVCALTAALLVAGCGDDNLFDVGVEDGIAPPNVSFSLVAPTVTERGGAISLSIATKESPRVVKVGASVLAIVSSDAGSELRVLEFEEEGRGAAFQIPLSHFGIPSSMTQGYSIDLQVHAYAVDDLGRCSAVSQPDTDGSDPCRVVDDVRLAYGVPTRRVVSVVRSQSVPVGSGSDLLMDLKTDGRRVFASNFSRNRVEVLPVGITSLAAPIRVGSEPWGLAVNPSGTELLVANSGGTSISRISVGGATLPAAEDANRRIQTRAYRVFRVEFDDVTGEPTSLETIAGDGVNQYSDRPQHIAQTVSGTLLFSTRPAPRDLARKGTVRRFNLVQGREELFRGDDSDVVSSPLEVSADSVRIIPGDEETPARLKVCFGTTCFEGDSGTVIDEILASDFGAQLGTKEYRPEFEFSDTTFVAVSGNHRAVVFGRSGVGSDPGRIFRFEDEGDGFAVNSGNTADLLKNAHENVFGLALNLDGSLGIARGQQSYVFDRNLRLHGVITTGIPSGGVAINPRQGTCPGQSSPECVAFVSGVEPGGGPYIDVVDTFHFDTLRRIPILEPVTGSLLAVPVGAPGSVGVRFRVYGIVPSGLVTVEIYPQDLVPR